MNQKQWKVAIGTVFIAILSFSTIRIGPEKEARLYEVYPDGTERFIESSPQPKMVINFIPAAIILLLGSLCVYDLRDKKK